MHVFPERPREPTSPSPHRSPKQIRRLIYPTVSFALLALILSVFAPTTSAQSTVQRSSTSYWEYSASGRLQEVQMADMDGDGVEELLVADENGRLALVSADGQVEWSIDAPGSITTMTFLDGPLDQPDDTLEVAVSGEGWLILLDGRGETVWRHDEFESEDLESNRPIPEEQLVTIYELHSYDVDGDGIDEILALMDTGQLKAYDRDGNEVWRYEPSENAASGTLPNILVHDFDDDGRNEIALGLFTTRRFSELLFLDEGELMWQQAVSRRISAMSATDFPDLGHGIAVSTSFGQLNLYDTNGALQWFRTVNRPITAMGYAELAGVPIVAVGTDAGSVVTFTSVGKRYWTNNLARDANREVVKLLPTEGQTATGQSGLAVLLESAASTSEPADVLLLGNNGQTLLQLGNTDLPAITRLVDVNHDNHNELLLARFATLQLLGLGVGNSEYVEEWQYGLDAVPTATLQIDLDRDGEDEIIVGTEDGRLHALSSDRSIRWLHAAGSEISALAALRTAFGGLPLVVVARQNAADEDEAIEPESWIELRSAQGELLWQAEIDGEISTLTVDEGNPALGPSILVGTTDGKVISLDGAGEQNWTFEFAESKAPVSQLLVLDSPHTSGEVILAVNGKRIFELSKVGDAVLALPFASLSEDIDTVYAVAQPGGDELSLSLVAFTTGGAVHGLNWRGIEMTQWPWPYQLDEATALTIPADRGSVEAFQENATAFLGTTPSGHFFQLRVVDNQPSMAWDKTGMEDATALYWDDLDKDGYPDTGLIGTRAGKVLMFEQMNTVDPHESLDLDLGSSVVTLSLLRRTASQSPDLLTVTENSLIRLFREEENRPPLLTRPTMSVDSGQLSAGVFISDVEGDPVDVALELFEPASGTWQPVSEQTLESGNGPLFWPAISPTASGEQLTYRFRFDDGFYRGYLTPPKGPQVPISPLFATMAPVVLALVGLAVLGGGMYVAQASKSTNVTARRFYRQIRQTPEDTLRLLEAKYEEVEGSPDLLLQLASLARQNGDMHVAGMSDGLFLLANRPQAGLSIILRTLDDVAADPNEAWSPIEQRHALYRNAYALLEAPSITELSLLRPYLLDVLANLDRNNEWSPILDSLLPVLANLRDSERVEAVDDRLVYLNQAAVRLRELQEYLPEFSPDVERTLVRVIARRWSSLISAEIEEQRGRAELQISLKTKRIVPSGQTDVAMEIRNNGRAPAENIIAMLEPNAAYHVFTPPQTIAFLPPGRSRQVRFLVEPRVPDRFRVALSLTFDDRNRTAKTQAFGDMVNLLPPVREFTPVANPYVPGTPLRRNSQLFYGREELFEFIREATMATAGRNVLMLVGQRRTGKTSALLRIAEYLPAHLIPVYIDCQSLGVTPGMPALLEELAWQIADTLGERGVVCEVPAHEAWDAEPTRLFQRTFLPQVRDLLPDDAILLLVFDEFEAFESMVDDGLLPRTFFTYMRHLMQHSIGLSFVFVGTRRLEEMSTDYWSVLFNIALYRKIDFLSDQAATRLITEPIAPNLIYDDLAIDKILRVTAGHPYFLQLVCYTLVKRANQERTGYVTISDVNEALEEMLRLGEVHFAYLWQRSSYTERALLTAAAHLADRNEPLYPEELTEYLQSYGVALDPLEVTAGLTSLVERDIMREVNEEGTTAYDLRIGLVGLWVAQNKSLSRLLAQSEV